ncbi:MAG TPA: methylamine utilization protein MauJ [Azospirillum sp.]|nr:methylamine utilization protein MauJ [Azospirillum sp.]
MDFQFGPFEIVALPPTDASHASLHLDLRKAKIDEAEAMSVLSQILSIATWVEDCPAMLIDGWSGNPGPTPVPRGKREPALLASPMLTSWVFARGQLEEPVARQALAIYREAVNLLHTHSLPYAVLGFFKILELRFSGKEREKWLVETIAPMLDVGEVEMVRHPDYREEYGTDAQAVGAFLYEQGRNAIAHARPGRSHDPDDITATRFLSLSVSLFQELARKFIENVLQISPDRWASE